jgi:hypothetical protein
VRTGAEGAGVAGIWRQDIRPVGVIIRLIRSQGDGRIGATGADRKDRLDEVTILHAREVWFLHTIDQEVVACHTRRGHGEGLVRDKRRDPGEQRPTRRERHVERLPATVGLVGNRALVALHRATLVHEAFGGRIQAKPRRRIRRSGDHPLVIGGVGRAVARRFAHRVRECRARIDAATQVDDAEGHGQDQQTDQRKLGGRLPFETA